MAVLGVVRVQLNSAALPVSATAQRNARSREGGTEPARTRCGNHYELGVATADGKIVVVSVYDMSASVKDINAMRGKKVEIDLAGKAVLGIRLSGEQNAKISALSGLSTRAPC